MPSPTDDPLKPRKPVTVVDPVTPPTTRRMPRSVRTRRVSTGAPEAPAGDTTTARTWAPLRSDETIGSRPENRRVIRSPLGPRATMETSTWPGSERVRTRPSPSTLSPPGLFDSPLMLLVDPRWDELTLDAIRETRKLMECRIDTACPTPYAQESARRLANRPGADPEQQLLIALRQHPTCIVNEIEALCDSITTPITATLVSAIADDLLRTVRLAIQRSKLLGL